MDPLKLKLEQIGSVQIRKPHEKPFVLKSGKTSHIYVDLRVLPQHPHLLSMIGDYCYNALHALHASGRLATKHFDGDGNTFLVGLPIGGVPLATVLAKKMETPQILIRKEPKAYGTSRLVELDFRGQGWVEGERRSVILVDDVITTGSTVIDTIERFKMYDVPLDVVAVVCILDRTKEKGKSDVVPGTTIPLCSVFSLDSFLRPPRMTFGERAANHVLNGFAQQLCKVIVDRQTNLCWSADIVDAPLLLEVFRQVAPYIVMIKLHHDCISTLSYRKLDYDAFWMIAREHNVLVLSDDKFADIGMTIAKKLAYHPVEQSGGPCSFTVHTISGPAGVEQIHNLGGSSVLVAEMSNKGSLTDDPYFSELYARKTAELASKHPEKIAGLVCQSRDRCNAGDGFIYMTPGVHEEIDTDGQDQRYRSADQAIHRDGCDVIIVGRGIYATENPAAAARMYRDAGRKALIEAQFPDGSCQSIM